MNCWSRLLILFSALSVTLNLAHSPNASASRCAHLASGQPTEHKLCLLRFGNSNERAVAAYLLGRTHRAKAAAAVTGLIQALKDPDPLVRKHAATSLGNIGLQAGPAIPLLMTALSERHPGVVIAAAEALGKIGRHATLGAEVIVVALLDLLTREDVVLRKHALLGLGHMGRNALYAIPHLTRVLRSKEPAAIKANAAFCLGEIGSTAEGAVDALSFALTSKHWTVRSAAAEALGKIGPAATLARGALQRATQDHEQSVRTEAVQALQLIRAAQRRSN